MNAADILQGGRVIVRIDLQPPRSFAVRRLLGLVIVGLALFLTVASAAQAREWSVGSGGTPFQGERVDLEQSTLAGQPGLSLQRKILWSYSPTGAGPFAPLSAQPLANGNVLITDRDNVSVVELNRLKESVWSFTRQDDPGLSGPTSAERLANGNTLITDRAGDRVIEVTPDKRVVWAYGAQRDSTAPGSLVDPCSATRLANGNTLITDNGGGTRVLEVKSGDYNASAANLGYTSASIVWRYGRDNEAGAGPGQLTAPRRATRLANGDTLIVDSAEQGSTVDRVVEVNPSGNIVWSFDGRGVSPAIRPADAVRLPDGTTVIVGETAGSVYVVDAQGHALQSYSSLGVFGDGSSGANLQTISRTPSGSVIIADVGTKRVFEMGYPAYGTLTSSDLDMSLPGVKKVFKTIEVSANKPETTAVRVDYSIDGGPWTTLAGALPATAKGVTLRYRVKLSTEDRGVTPVLGSVRVTYELAPTTTSTTRHTTVTTRRRSTGTTYRTRSNTGTGLGTSTGTTNRAILDGSRGRTTPGSLGPGTTNGMGNVPAVGENSRASTPDSLPADNQADPSDGQYAQGQELQPVGGSDGSVAASSGDGDGGGPNVALVVLAGSFLVCTAAAAIHGNPAGARRLVTMPVAAGVTLTKRVRNKFGTATKATVADSTTADATTTADAAGPGAVGPDAAGPDAASEDALAAPDGETEPTAEMPTPASLFDDLHAGDTIAQPASEEHDAEPPVDG